jgi:hypothetical protein
MAIVDPNGLNSAIELILYIDNFLSYFFVDIDVIFPVLQTIIPHVVEILEVVEKWSQNVFVKQKIRAKLL